MKKLVPAAISRCLNGNGFRLCQMVSASSFNRKTINVTSTFKYAAQSSEKTAEDLNDTAGHRKGSSGEASNAVHDRVYKPKPLIPLDGTDHHSRKRHKARLGNEKKETNVLFGIHPVFLALQAKRRELKKLFIKRPMERSTSRINEIVELAREMEIPVAPTSTVDLDRLSGHRPHQGVCLDAGHLTVPFVDEEEGEEDPKPLLWLLLNEIHDPMNLGAILRTAYYYGVDRVLGPVKGNCTLSPVVSKASSGILEVIHYNYVKDIPTLLKRKSLEGWDIVGTITKQAADTESSVVNVDHYTPCKSSLIIVGNEGRGLDESILRLCNVLLTIPQQVIQQPISLNVSVATGIVLHALTTNRQKSSKQI